MRPRATTGHRIVDSLLASLPASARRTSAQKAATSRPLMTSKEGWAFLFERRRKARTRLKLAERKEGIALAVAVQCSFSQSISPPTLARRFFRFPQSLGI